MTAVDFPDDEYGIAHRTKLRHAVGMTMLPDADKGAGELPSVAHPENDLEKPRWRRPTVTKIPVKDIVFASPGSFHDGMSGSVATC
jgi:hypothetical protein